MLLQHQKLDKHFLIELLLLKINFLQVKMMINNISLNQKKGFIDHQNLKIKMKLTFGKEENTMEMYHQQNLIKEKDFN